MSYCFISLATIVWERQQLKFGDTRQDFLSLKFAAEEFTIQTYQLLLSYKHYF